MTVTEEIRALALERALGRRRSPRSPCADGMRRCATTASRRSRLGLTSIAEVARVTGSG